MDSTNKGIELTGIQKYYGKEAAVSDLDLRVNPGEFLTILGPSGCGKTTILRIIAGLEEPDRGELRFGDRIIFSREKGIIVSPEKRGVGLIFQSYALWPHMNVERNITLALKEQKLSPPEIQKRLDTALKMVKLDGLGNRYPSELSGGQQQRVAVARLIATRASILLMDEPLSNLDAMLRTDMRSEMKRLHRKLEATTIYVTHDQVEALTLSDVVVVMNNGVVQQQASPYDIYHHPANLFVAEFIGDPRINRFEGRIIKGIDNWELDLGVFRLPLETHISSNGGNVIATARPENVNLSVSEKDKWHQAVIETVQPTGSETIVQVRTGDVLFTAVKPGFVNLAVDQSVWIHISPEALGFFDPDTGENLIIGKAANHRGD